MNPPQDTLRNTQYQRSRHRDMIDDTKRGKLEPVVTAIIEAPLLWASLQRPAEDGLIVATQRLGERHSLMLKTIHA